MISSKLSTVKIDIFPWEPLNHSVLGDISHPAGYNPFRHDITAVCHFSLLVPSFCKNAHTALIIHALQCRSTASDTSKWFRECHESSSFLRAMSETDFFLSPNFINQNPKARRTLSECQVRPWVIPALDKVSQIKKCHRKQEAVRSLEVLTCQGSVSSLEKRWRREADESPWSARHLSAFGWDSEPGGKSYSWICQNSEERSPGQPLGLSGFKKSQAALKTLLLKVNREHLVVTNTLLSMHISPESWLANAQRQEHGEERWRGEGEWARERKEEEK